MSTTTGLAAMPSSTLVPSFDTCKDVSALCPVDATTLSYYPSLGANVFFAVGFGACFIASFVLGISKRTWTYGLAICVGLAMEVLGYIGRVLLHENPWDKSAFGIQITCIIIGPTFICIAIYLTLKHVSLHLNPTLSRISPVWYPRIFLTSDISCIVLQAIGGGVAGGAKRDDVDTANTGNRIIIAGVVLQVVVLALFGLMSLDYWVRVSSYFAGNKGAVDENARALWIAPRFRIFIAAVTTAYSAILIRCIYRIAEMAGGWGNSIMQEQVSFIILDGCLMLVASILLTVFHPGIFFSAMSGFSRKARKTANVDGDTESGSGQPSRSDNKESWTDRSN